MAAYVWKRTKQTKSKYANEPVRVTKSNTTYETVELSVEQTFKERSDHGLIGTRVLKNPTILDTLDPVHRSLLFNNLKFEPGEPQHLDGRSSSNSSHSATTTDECSSNAEAPLESVATRNTDPTLAQNDDQRHGKVNIALAASRSAGGSNEDRLAAGDAASNDGSVPVEEDWNNNINGAGGKRSVRMMVQQYEKAKATGRNDSVPPDRAFDGVGGAGRTFSSERLHHASSGCDVETSDFESASVTSSGSSGVPYGGCRSVRTSSAFSEGSRDVASIERFDLAAPETQVATDDAHQQQNELGGHNTMITININYRCDTNPLRTGNRAAGAEGEAAGEKTVDIVVSAPPEVACTGDARKSSLTVSDKIATDEPKRLGKVSVHDHAKNVACDLMDLEEEQTSPSARGYEIDLEGVQCENRSQNKTDHYARHRRSSGATNRSCRTPDNEEYHDCDELHDSTLSFYEQATSQPVTPQDREKTRRSRGHNSSTSSSGDSRDAVDGADEPPMIRIVQELTEDQGEVTSTITLNKAQIQEMQKMNGKEGAALDSQHGETSEKRRKSRGSNGSCSKKRYDKSNLHRQQRIIDDNFCNEILDSTIHFDRLIDNNRGKNVGVGKATSLSPSPTRALAEECFSDSVVCDIGSPGDESFDSGMSVGKLEGKPRYSNKTIGRLMMKRLKKLQQLPAKGAAPKGGSGGGNKTDTSDASTSSSQMLQTSGPKKPPRTFANSPKRSVLPSCPTRKDLDDSDPSVNGIGWKLDANPKAHHVGWSEPAAAVLAGGKNQSIPPQVYNMLHYSEDESRKRLIRTGNSKPAPQQSSLALNKHTKHQRNDERKLEPLGPKLNIDTVDGTTTPPPRRHSSSTDFDRFVKDSNVKSTPHGREKRQNSRSGEGATGAGGIRRTIEQFLNDERQSHPAHRKLPVVPAVAERRRRTTGGIFERRRQQQENFLDDARRTNHEPRTRKAKEAPVPPQQPRLASDQCCPMAARKADSLTRNSNSHSGASVGGKVAKRRTFRKAAILTRTRTLYEASKKKIWAMKKFETPKKMNTVSSTKATTTTPSKAHGHGHDPNINRNSSAKKKQNLHHKHLGFTPDRLRCRSCHAGDSPASQPAMVVDEEDEDVDEVEGSIVPQNHRVTQSEAPNRASFPGEESKVNDFGRERNAGTNRKSVRSLNFASASHQHHYAPPPERLDGGREETAPRKSGLQLLNETKFLKTLRNLKISPKKMFRFASQSSTTGGGAQCAVSESESHGQGEFLSFDDMDVDKVARMGPLLSNIQRLVEGDVCESERGMAAGSPRRQVHVHGEEEPIYQEISPKGNKMILNEFISSETNKRYLMVNNNPNILYATVSKPFRGARERPGLLVRARSLTNVVSAGEADPIVTSTPVSKPQNNTSKSQMKPSNRRAATLSPDDDGDDDDGVAPRRDAGDVNGKVDEGEGESCLYHTALADESCWQRRPGRPERRRGRDGAGGESSGGGGRPSTSATAISASATRRSLFSQGSSYRSSRERTVSTTPQSTDESDVSVLQDEEKFVVGVPARRARGQGATPFVEEPLIEREQVENRLTADVHVRREHECFQQKPVSFGRGDGNGQGAGYQQRANGGQVVAVAEEDPFSFEKDIIVEERKEVSRSGQVAPERAGVRITSFPKKNNNVGAAPLGCFDTDSEIESLHFRDTEINELKITLADNVALSEMGSIETGTMASSASNDLDTIGYDTVDFATPVGRVFQCPPERRNRRNLTVDTVDVSALISHPEDDHTFATSNVSPIKGSPSSGGKVLWHLKDKLRSSFRKSKSFIKGERQRITSYLREERSGGSKASSTCSSSSTSSSPRKGAGRSATVTSSGQDLDEHSVARGSSAIISADSMTELSNQYMSDLILQIKRQTNARSQLKQALAICRSTREFECSPELIEAERLLLLATLKETAARNELSRIDYAANGMTLAKRKRVGVVALNHFEFPLKDTAVSDALFNYFYLVVCTYKNQVKGTVVTERRHDGRVYFRDCEVRFTDLDADYEIRVEVFVLRLRKNMKNYSFESRYHLEKDPEKRSLGCPSPSKKLRDAGKMLSFRSSSPKTFDFDNEFSRFKSQGFLTLTSFALITSNGGEPSSSAGRTFDATYTTARTDTSDHTIGTEGAHDGVEPSAHSPYYSVSSNFQQLIRRQGNDNVFLVEDFKQLTLDSMAYTSNMAGTIGMSVNSEVRYEGSDVRGFLDVGEKSDGGDGISWNRRWCKVNGFVLEFWNYPQECQEKQPIQCIDLVRCVNERIELAERSICSRPRTFRVDIFSSQVAAGAPSCNSSGIGSYKSSGATTSPNSVGEVRSAPAGNERLGAVSPTGHGRNTVTCFLLAADTQADLKRWLNELNRAVKFLKEWKI